MTVKSMVREALELRGIRVMKEESGVPLCLEYGSRVISPRL